MFAYQETFRAPGPYISWPLYFTGSVQIEGFFFALSAHCVYPDSSKSRLNALAQEHNPATDE